MYSKHFLYFKIVLLVFALSLSLFVYKNAKASCLYGPGTGSCTEGTCDGTCCSGSCCEGSCGCTPNCTSKSCGSDTCGGSCGTCGTGYSCTGGTCVPTTPPTTVPPVTTLPTTPPTSNTCTVGGGACCSSDSTCPYGASKGSCESGQKCCESTCGCQPGTTKDCTIFGTCSGKQTCGSTGLWGSCIAKDSCCGVVCAYPYACSGGSCVKVCNGCTTAGCDACSSMENGYKCVCSNPIAGGYLNCTGSPDLTCCPSNQIVGGVCVPSGATCPPLGDSCGTNGQAPCRCGCLSGLSNCPVIGGGNVCTAACAVNKYSCDSLNHQCYIDASGAYTSYSDCTSACAPNKCGCDSNNQPTCSASGTGASCSSAASCTCAPKACSYTVCECSGGNCSTVTKSGTEPCPANDDCSATHGGAAVITSSCGLSTATVNAAVNGGVAPYKEYTWYKQTGSTGWAIDYDQSCSSSGCSSSHTYNLAGQSINAYLRVGDSNGNVWASNILSIDCNSTHKYLCNSTNVCVQDDTRGIYSTSTCDGKCTPLSPPLPPPPVICSIDSLTITPSTIFLGGAYKATWDASGCTDCTLTCNTAGCGVPLTGVAVGVNQTDYPIKPTLAASGYTYTLTCVSPSTSKTVNAGVDGKLLRVIRPFWHETPAFLKLLVDKLFQH